MISSITINNSYTVSISESASPLKILIFKHNKTPVSYGRMIKMLPLNKDREFLSNKTRLVVLLMSTTQPRPIHLLYKKVTTTKDKQIYYLAFLKNNFKPASLTPSSSSISCPLN